jgi:hypothetical protein
MNYWLLFMLQSASALEISALGWIRQMKETASTGIDLEIFRYEAKLLGQLRFTCLKPILSLVLPKEYINQPSQQI